MPIIRDTNIKSNPERQADSARVQDTRPGYTADQNMAAETRLLTIGHQLHPITQERVSTRNDLSQTWQQSTMTTQRNDRLMTGYVHLQ